MSSVDLSGVTDLLPLFSFAELPFSRAKISPQAGGSITKMDGNDLGLLLVVLKFESGGSVNGVVFFIIITFFLY